MSSWTSTASEVAGHVGDEGSAGASPAAHEHALVREALERTPCRDRADGEGLRDVVDGRNPFPGKQQAEVDGEGEPGPHRVDRRETGDPGDRGRGQGSDARWRVVAVSRYRCGHGTTVIERKRARNVQNDLI